MTLAAVAVGAAFVLRRRAAGAPERIDLYFEDGSMATIEGDEPNSQELLDHAREAFAAVRAD